MKTFREDFMLPSESSIQDAFDGIEHWTKVIPVGTKYSLSIRETEALLVATWQAGFVLPIKFLNPFDIYDSLVKTSKSVVPMLIGLTFTETPNGIHVDVLLLGAIDKGMGDYKSLKTHLLTGSGIPDRAFDRYLTEQTKKSATPTPNPELRSFRGNLEGVQRASVQNCCPHCNSEISLSGLVKPDGSVICPKCFKRFMP